MTAFHTPTNFSGRYLDRLGEPLADDMRQLARLVRVSTRGIDNRSCRIILSKLVCHDWYWRLGGKPFFRLYPNCSEMLANVGLSVPVELLRTPFNSFVIQLAESDPTFAVGPYRGTSIRVFNSIDFENAGQAIEAHQEYVATGSDEPHSDRRSFTATIEALHENGRSPTQYVTLSAMMDRKPGIIVDQALTSALNVSSLTGQTVTASDAESSELLRRALSVAVSVCFLATGQDKLVEPYVLSKDLAAWIEAKRRGDSDRMRQLSDRAARRGERGFNVGREEPRRIVSALGGTGSDGDGCGHGISHSYQRRFHFRKLASGKVTFVRQHTVKPELPPKSEIGK